MRYKVAADFVVFIHFLWIIFLMFGAFIGRKFLPIKIIHIAGLVFSVIMQIFGWYCPLTHLEIWLRGRHDTTLSYSGSFIVHYIEKIVYIELSTWIIFGFTLVLVGTSAYIYLMKGKN